MILNVPDMNCDHCRAAIEKAVTDAGGKAAVDLTARQVTVSGLDADLAMKVIREAGYEPQPA